MIRKLLICTLALVLAGCGADENSWTTSSGLQVTEVVRGEGATPKEGEILSVHYTAWYWDGKKVGKEIVSTLNNENPHKFRQGVGQVIPGFDEGVSTMRKGGKRTFIVPPELAFGVEGRKGVVPPNSWIKLEIELLDIEPAPRTPDPWNDAGLEMVTLESGLQFVDFEIGDGEQPRIGSTVAVHYAGYLDDASCFDTSYHGYPLEFVIERGNLIEGWLYGLLTMKAGGRRKLIVPPYLAYGDEGFGEKVPPNATLTFDITLIEVTNP
jgi:peptidylprolyl isomerase